MGTGGPTGPAFTFDEIAAGTVIQTSFPLDGRSALDVELRDLDGDQDLDVTVTDAQGWWPYGSGSSRIYLREGSDFRDVWDAAFASIPMSSEALRSGEGRSALWATLSGAGRLDLAAGSNIANGSVYRNLGPSEPVLGFMPGFPDARLPSNSFAAGDINGDGWLDLVVGAFETFPRIYVNRWSTRSSFVEDTEPRFDAGVYETLASAFRPLLIDFDQDGDLDLFLSMGITYASTMWISRAQWEASPLTVRYFENDGSGNFTDRSSILAPLLFIDGSTAFGDLDNDGDLDIVQIGGAASLPDDGSSPPEYDPTADEMRVLRNDWDGVDLRFADVTPTAFPFVTPPGYMLHFTGEGAAMADFNNDGYLDVLIHRDYTRLWESRADPATISFVTEREIDDVIVPSTVAVGDLEPDGDVDFAYTDSGSTPGVLLMENQRGGQHVVRVRIDDMGSPNRYGVGAHVRVYGVSGEARGPLVAYRHVLSSTDQHTDYSQHVALPDAGCYEVEVTWPRVAGVVRVERQRVASQAEMQTLVFP